MNTSEESKQKKQKKLALQKKYEQRITIARQAREAFFAKDYITASKKYNDFLAVHAELNEIEDVYKLSPAMFDPKKNVAEMLLISHVYWELARIHEMAPKLQGTFQKALSQFVKFSINQPYQVLNSEMLRKYIKKNKRTSVQIGSLNTALSQIHIQSKKCFIATECFGSDHPVTKQLRVFKEDLIRWPFGVKFIEFYYNCSSQLINKKKTNSFIATNFILLLKTPLRLFAKFTKTSIFKRCSYYLKLLQKNGSSH